MRLDKFTIKFQRPATHQTAAPAIRPAAAGR